MAGINFTDEREYEPKLTFKNNDAIHSVSNSIIIESQLCPKCREKGSLKNKSYLMFSRVCRNDGTYVKLPTHPDYTN
jgi:hypothetical protein